MPKNKGNLALRENSTHKRHSDHGLDHLFASGRTPVSNPSSESFGRSFLMTFRVFFTHRTS